jgi:uncharacterized protein
MRKIVAALILAASAGALSLSVVETPVHAKSSDGLALTLSKLMLTDETYSQTLQQVSAGIAQSMAAAGGRMPPDFADKIEKVVREALPRNEMLQFNAQVYGSRFSDPELQEIIDFYKTPTGIKILREMPSISREVSVKVGQLIPQRLPELMKKHGLLPKGEH